MSKPSTYRMLDRLVRDAVADVNALNGQLYDLCENLREAGEGDEDYDPTEGIREKLELAKVKRDALAKAKNDAPDDRTPEEIEEDDEAEACRETHADRRLRWQENGCPGDGPDDY